MGQVIAVTSGKGGTGKTTISAGIAECLAAEGFRVLCIDADVGLRNLDISLGMADTAPVSFQTLAMGSPAGAATSGMKSGCASAEAVSCEMRKTVSCPLTQA